MRKCYHHELKCSFAKVMKFYNHAENS